MASVTGRYLSDHEERVQIDREREREAAAERFWRTRDFDPVTAAYYDGEKVCGVSWGLTRLSESV